MFSNLMQARRGSRNCSCTTRFEGTRYEQNVSLSITEPFGESSCHPILPAGKSCTYHLRRPLHAGNIAEQCTFEQCIAQLYCLSGLSAQLNMLQHDLRSSMHGKANGKLHLAWDGAWLPQDSCHCRGNHGHQEPGTRLVLASESTCPDHVHENNQLYRFLKSVRLLRCLATC